MEVWIESDTVTINNVPYGMGSIARLVLSTVYVVQYFRSYTFVSYLGLFPKKKMLAAARKYGALQCLRTILHNSAVPPHFAHFAHSPCK